MKEMLAWYRERKVQLIPYPLDPISQTIIAPTISGRGLGSSALTQVYNTGLGDTVTAPKAYSDTVIVRIDGVNYEIPFLSNPS